MKTRQIAKLILLTLLTGVAGCSTTEENTLVLESVMDAKEKKLAATERIIAEHNEEKISVEDKELLSISNFDPPELIWLQLPKHFAHINVYHSDFKRLVEGLSEKFPGVSSIWRSEKDDVLVAAGKTPLQPEAMASLSHEALVDEVEKLGAQYAAFYKKAYQGIVKYDVGGDGRLVTLFLESGYNAQGFQHNDVRYTFFYTPSYRLNFLLTGTQRDLDAERSQAEPAIQKFKEKLVLLSQEENDSES